MPVLLPPPPPPQRQRIRRVDHVPAPLLPWFSTLHAWLIVVSASALLGVALSRSALLATVHLVGTIGAVLAVGTLSKRPDLILAVTVYAGLSDVLWRSSSARGPWEAGKYAVILGFFLLTVRFVKRPKNLVVCLGMVLLLLPAVFPALFELPFARARSVILASLNGPIAIPIAVLACSNLRVTSRELRGLYLIALSPIVSMCAVATMATTTSKSLDFSTQSNFAAAGGFGPNQVSSLLCVGALLCILVTLQRGVNWGYRAAALATAVWLAGQAVLTFSRGGVIGLVAACAAVGLVALNTAGQRWRAVVAAGVLVVVAFQIMSWAGTFTGGASEERFGDTDTTNRTKIAASDLRLFASHPLLGVGVGMAIYERDIDLYTSPHTEFTRLPAEHGLLGVIYLGLLVFMCVRIVRRADGWYRMASVGLLVITIAQLGHSATKIASIPVAFGLAALLQDRQDPTDG